MKFEVLTEVKMSMQVFWFVMLYGLAGKSTGRLSMSEEHVGNIRQ
jgi:hypothetical protein